MNPQEIPEALDLSKDIASQWIQLSPEQQKSFQEYLDTLKAEEKQAIISLTQGEIQDLKSILINFDPRANTPQQTIASFIESQKSEGLSLTDFVPTESVFSEQLGNTEKLVWEALFWNPWILKDMNLSETAQNIFASGMSLALLEEMGKNPSSIDVSGLMKDPQDLSSLESLAKKMLPLALLTREKESVWMGSIVVSKLYISENGDTNAIFQDPLEAQKLITGIISGEISEDGLEIYIEERNNTPARNIDAKAIQKHLVNHLGAIESRLKDTQTTQDPKTAAQEAVAAVAPDANEEEKQSILEAFLKLFKEFVDGFIGVGKKVFGTIEAKTWEDKVPDTENTPDKTELNLNGKTILIKHSLVQEQIGNAVQDTQKPTQTEILSILKNFQNSNFSDEKNLPENSAQALYALQVALSNQGYDVGTIDGIDGPNTQTGIRSYQKSIGLTETGKIDTALFLSPIEKMSPKTPETTQK